MNLGALSFERCIMGIKKEQRYTLTLKTNH